VNPTIVGKSHRRGVVIPIVLALRDVRAEGRQDRPVVSLHLPFCLGLVRRREHLCDAKFRVSGLEELDRELRPVICQKGDMGTIDIDPLVNEGPCH
jgi:hypothetical protein